MEFFNKLGKKASEAYKVTADKTGKLAKEAKLRVKMGELKSEINNIYEDMGKTIYENHLREEKQDIEDNLEEKCTKIDCLSDEIESILRECLELKDKKQCSKCHTKIEKDAKFCPQCGEKQEVVEEEPAKEVEIVEEENNDGKSDLEETIEVESNVNLKDDETIEHLEAEDE